MFKNKKYIRFLITSALFFSLLSVTFNIGILDNPNFSFYDLCLSLASELLGLLLTILVVDTYFNARREYMTDRARHILADKQTPAKEEAKEEPEATEKTPIGNNFEILQSNGNCEVKSISTIIDKETGARYLLVVHEHGSALTPLLDKNNK